MPFFTFRRAIADISSGWKSEVRGTYWHSSTLKRLTIYAAIANLSSTKPLPILLLEFLQSNFNTVFCPYQISSESLWYLLDWILVESHSSRRCNLSGKSMSIERCWMIETIGLLTTRYVAYSGGGRWLTVDGPPAIELSDVFWQVWIRPMFVSL